LTRRTFAALGSSDRFYQAPQSALREGHNRRTLAEITRSSRTLATCFDRAYAELHPWNIILVPLRRPN